MTKSKYDYYLSSTETQQLAILNGLSNENKGRINVWLETVQVIKDANGEPYIVSPFYGNLRIYTNKDISYLVFYKWCVDKAKLPKPLDDIFYYAYKWKKDPIIDPYTNVNIEVSLNPTSKYVRLYKQIMDELISKLLEKKGRKVLSIEECKKIKDSLPDEHAYGGILQLQYDSDGQHKEKIYYDYLFIVYFIKSETIKYDIAFQRELRIYLDLAVYDTSPFLYKEGVAYTSEQNTVNHLYFEFMGAYVSNRESEISISSLAKRLCIDISNLQQYMRESKPSKISSDTINNVHFNLNVLKYCKNIPFGYLDRREFKKILLELFQDKEKITGNNEYDDIYGSIKYHIEEVEGASSNIFDTFISIYNTIVKLYSRNYTYIKDNYDEPQILPKERAKSESIIRKSSIYIVKPKAFSDGDKRKRSSSSSSTYSTYKEVIGYYNNDRDPYTLEDFVDMHLKKQKYVSDIVYDNKDLVFHYRFDTVHLYNYILHCIEKCIKLKNLITNTDLTDANLDEVCKKIKHFTKKPTYDSSKEIRQSLIDCKKKYKYNNFLIIMLFKEMPEEQKEKDIIGRLNIYLDIKLGDISFECFGDDSGILTLPIFSNKQAFADYNKLAKDILNKIEAKISVGELICDKFFPYRRNKKITNLPDFTFELDDDAKETFEKLKRYKEKIERL